MNQLYFIRHGETEMNVAGKFSGHLDTKLTPNGVEQARSAGKKHKQKKIEIDLIISSPLSRAFTTAKLIAREINYPLEKILLNSLFVERGYGELEGKVGQAFYKKRSFKEIDEVKNAETVEQLQRRADKALAYLFSRPEENIMVVSHGALGRALKRSVLKLPHDLEFDEAHRIKHHFNNAQIVQLI